ncbi:AraC family transcriptional regulator [Parasphingopyxis algicola]|uniref:AraC family transcriptional regulator n=1 Tax=Parasphingopyxis algicola TaxID=2026624 RepID=UPI0015A34030|nr:helix-turn-helix domain-containing protein [Parasphingopyxis algicola]QLC24725.1 AraC family transcriptional regulator [Parasphingopyxis algicola]
MAPDHSLGYYRAWHIAPADTLPFDMLWTSRAPERKTAAHHFLPFVEPSIVVRRKRRREAVEYNTASLCVSSAFPDSGWYDPEPEEELIGLRLRPETSSAQLGISPRDYRDLEPVEVPRRLRDLLSDVLRSAERGRSADVARALQDGLLRIAAPSRTGAASTSAHFIRARNGRISCKELAQITGLSERQMRRAFVDEFGTAPKSYARRLRLTTAIVRAETGSGGGWADIALASGYSDQSHLIRDCRALTGLSPRALMKERRAMSALFNN